MANTYKVLGQSNPAATTLTTLYTVPSATSTVVSTLCVCNTSTSASFRVAIRPAGAAIATSQYIIYDSVISANDSVFLTLGVSLAATDVISVYSSSTGLTFSAFGSEIV